MRRRSFLKAVAGAVALQFVPGDCPNRTVNPLPQRFCRSCGFTVPAFGNGFYREHFGDRRLQPFVNSLHHDIPPNSWLTLCWHGDAYHAAGFEEDPARSGQKPPTLFEFS